MTIYKSKNPKVNREFSEGQETEDKILAALKKIPEMNNYERIDIDENGYGDLIIKAIAYKNVINISDEFKSKHPALKNIAMIQRELNEDMSWNNAMNYAKNLKLNGFSDWRLPTIEETKEIVKIYGKQMGAKTILWTSEQASATGAYTIVVYNNTAEIYSKDVSRVIDCFCVR